MALEVFALTEQWPKSYQYDVTSQIRRAALSVPTNIAEGCATAYTKELLQFLNIAQRSVSETQYLLRFALDRSLMSEAIHGDLHTRYDEVGRMLHGLQNSLKHRAQHPLLATSH